MVSSGQWVVLNVSLGVVALFLLLYLFDAPTAVTSMIGKAQYAAVTGEPECSVRWENVTTPIADLNECCLGAASVLSCSFSRELGVYVCSSQQEDLGLGYVLNPKAYSYCTTQAYWKR